MKVRILISGLLLAGSGSLSDAASIDLECTKTGMQDEVRLDWNGGLPDYGVYRSESPAALMDPVNEIAMTAASSWIDLPPVGSIFYYAIDSLCDGSVEVCNGVDDDCDGIIDNGSFSDVWEPNSNCGAVANLGTIGSDERLIINPTIYAEGDVDYFRFTAMESDSTCACCDVFCFDEDYLMTVQLTVPAGAGSYSLCISSSDCSSVGDTCISVGDGQTDDITIGLDGSCSGNPDSYQFFVRIEGSLGSFACSPYELDIFFDAQVCL